MSSTLLRLNADILVEVVANYERLVAEKKENPQVQQLRNQILYLLAAIRKENR